MARGKPPVSFRTRKLSLSAPMVLPRGRGGRVGRRRTTIPEGAPASVLGPLRAVLPPSGLRPRKPPAFVDKVREELPRRRCGSAAAGFLRRRAHVVGQP